MSRTTLGACLLLFCGGCFSAQGGAERNHDCVRKGMDRSEVRWAIGTPKEILPIPGQGNSPDLPTEQWRYEWRYTPAKTLTVVLTAFIGLFFMDFHPYGFDVGFGRDGRVLTITDVGQRPR